MTDTNRDAAETFKALQEKLASATDWRDCLPEAIKYFSENMPLVLMESPYGADDPETLAANIAYAKAAFRDMVNRGEIPFASHLKYTQDGLLDDDDPAQRTLGIAAGLAEGMLTKKTAVYIDRGFSGGMLMGIKESLKVERPVELRSLNTDDPQSALEAARKDLLEQLGEMAQSVKVAV